MKIHILKALKIYSYKSAFLVFSLLQLSQLASSATPASAQSAKSLTAGLIIEQHAAMKNEFNIWVTPSAVRADNISNGYSLVSKAPDWQVSIWRPDQKVIATVSFKYWCQISFRKYSWTCDLEKPINEFAVKAFDQQATKYVFASTPQVGVFMRSAFGDNSNTNDRNHTEIVQLKYPGSEHTGPIIGRLQMLPVLQGFPLSAQRFRADGNIEGAISTIKFSQSKTIPVSMFTTPADYKPVNFSLALMRTAAINGMEKDFANSFFK